MHGFCILGGHIGPSRSDLQAMLVNLSESGDGMRDGGSLEDEEDDDDRGGFDVSSSEGGRSILMHDILSLHEWYFNVWHSSLHGVCYSLQLHVFCLTAMEMLF